MLEMVKTNPFIPMKWMKEHKGMQGTEFFTEEDSTLHVKNWLVARDYAMYQANALSEYGGVSKQICNRLLEPFMYHTVIVTGSEFENFFALRAHPDAEIHIAHLAQLMLDAYNDSIPKELKAGEWHIPFGDNIGHGPDQKRMLDCFDPVRNRCLWTMRAKIATARCARVSYLNFEGKDDYEADIRLHDQLLASGHMSPFEHCARAMSSGEYADWGVSVDGDYQYGWCGNFRGFIQYRKLLPGENKSDSRVIKK